MCGRVRYIQRIAALHALVGLGSRSAAIDWVFGCFEDEDEDVRNAAVQTLAKLTECRVTTYGRSVFFLFCLACALSDSLPPPLQLCMSNPS